MLIYSLLYIYNWIILQIIFIKMLSSAAIVVLYHEKMVNALLK